MAADSGMDTCPSPEISDSRKRPLDGESENGDVKRSHFSSVQDLVTALPLANGHSNLSSQFGSLEPTYHFKVLVPSMVAGAIIGKGGETIAQLQKDTGARVKMSKSHDFYPGLTIELGTHLDLTSFVAGVNNQGTTERACLITGSVEGILVVLDFIMDKIKEKPELVKPFPDGVDAKMPQDRDKQVKILVPNSTAGMIIGKGGNYIKQIKEQSGSYVQISQKAKELSLQERCITVVGEKEGNKKACMMILQKVVDDPQSGSCPNVSYADVSGPVANYNPTGSPYATQGADGVGVPVGGALGVPVGGVPVGGMLVNGGGVGVPVPVAGSLSLALNLAPPGTAPPQPLSPQLIDHIKAALRGSGWTEGSVGEVSAALSLLVKLGVVGLALPAAHAHAHAHAALQPHLAHAHAAHQAHHAFYPLGPPPDQAAVFGPIGQVSLAVAPVSFGGGAGGAGGAGGPGAASLLPLSKSPTPAPPPSSAPAPSSPKDAKNINIPEVIVGAILGPGGRSLVEIQHMSGASIQISKKGTFAPGTRNRIVTISGSPAAIGAAHLLIEQKVAEEEHKRSRHSALATLLQ